jgi:ribosomal protein S18 acetylase RimI-like enzyme
MARSSVTLSGYDLLMDVVQAAVSDIAQVMEIVALCVRQMREAGSHQWDEFYPTREIMEADIKAGTLYLLRENGRAIGAIVVNEVQSPEYVQLSWRQNETRPLVIHRLCVRPERQKSGAARRLMDFAEDYARANGYASIRLDTYTGNPRARALYESRGYEARGYVRFRGRKLPFVCFELLLHQ